MPSLPLDTISDDNTALYTERLDRLRHPRSQRLRRVPPAPERPNPWHVNVDPAERIASSLVGGALIASATYRPNTLKVMGGLLGAALIARGISGHCFGYALFNASSNGRRKPASPTRYQSRGIQLKATTSVNRPADEVYAFWRKLDNLPRFMRNIESVTPTSATRSTWIARAPFGTDVQWDAEIIADEPGQRLAWRSLGNADVDNAGTIRFLDNGDRGTDVQVTIDYIPPLGRAGILVAKLFGQAPGAQAKEDLRRFKQLIETGELPRVDPRVRGQNC